jgi:hypothetical protein
VLLSVRVEVPGVAVAALDAFSAATGAPSVPISANVIARRASFDPIVVSFVGIGMEVDSESEFTYMEHLS